MQEWKVYIEKDVLEKMHEHAEQTYPDECCGFMYGEYQEDDSRSISRVRPVTNAKEGDKSNRFQIDPLDYQKAEQFALQNKLDLVGVYHSHPDHPGEPSQHDLKQAMPVFSYVIISVQNGVTDHTRSWRLDEQNEFQEEKVFEKIIKPKT